MGEGRGEGCLPRRGAESPPHPAPPSPLRGGGDTRLALSGHQRPRPLLTRPSGERGGVRGAYLAEEQRGPLSPPPATVSPEGRRRHAAGVELPSAAPTPSPSPLGGEGRGEGCLPRRGTESPPHPAFGHLLPRGEKKTCGTRRGRHESPPIRPFSLSPLE